MADEMKQEIKKEKKHSGLGTAALVLGIIGIVLSFIPIINNAAFVLGLIGALLGIVCLIKRASKTTAAVGLILCVCAMGITLLMQDSFSKALDDASSDLETAFDDLDGSNTDKLLQNSIGVEFDNFVVDKDTYWTNTKLPVKITNKEKETKSFSVHVEAKDPSGNRIGDDYIYVNDLGANQSQMFDCFTYISSDDLAKYETATFSVVEVSMY